MLQTYCLKLSVAMRIAGEWLYGAARLLVMPKNFHYSKPHINAQVKVQNSSSVAN